MRDYTICYSAFRVSTIARAARLRSRGGRVRIVCEEDFWKACEGESHSSSKTELFMASNSSNSETVMPSPTAMR
jgi:hypothetical protein